MADIDDAESEITQMQGVENAWAGRVLSRLVRAVRFLHGRVLLLGQRITDLEARVSALENPPPPP